MAKMNAVVAYGAKNYRFEQINIPEVGPGEVLIEIPATGICASDRSIYKGGDPWGVWSGVPRVHTPGHEFAGKVVELGEGAAKATGLQVGDQATAELRIPCRTCFYCVRGFYHLCINSTRWVGGSWAEYMKFPEGAIVHKIPNSVSPEEAALIEPLTCSAHAVERAQISQIDTVVVAGLGGIGMGVVQIARLRNPHRLIGIDIEQSLCDTALELGADYAFNPKTHDIDEEIKALTGGIGCDIYIEVSGSTQSLQTSFKVLRKRGKLAVYGVYREEVSLDFNQVSEFKELEIIGGHLSPWVYPSVIQYLARGEIQAKPMITHTFPLKDFEEAIAVKYLEPSIKTILIP